MASTDLQERTKKIVPFVFDRDYVDFILIEIDRFEQPMTRTLLSFLKKRYGDDFWYVVDIEGDQRIDAYVLGGPEVTTDDSEVIHIYSIAVRRNFEGHGWAKKLMLHLMEKAKEAGKKAIILEVRENNTRAIEFYHHLEFESTGKIEKYYDDETDAITMRYNL